MAGLGSLDDFQDIADALAAKWSESGLQWMLVVADKNGQQWRTWGNAMPHQRDYYVLSIEGRIAGNVKTANVEPDLRSFVCYGCGNEWWAYVTVGYDVENKPAQCPKCRKLEGHPA